MKSHWSASYRSSAVNYREFCCRGSIDEGSEDGVYSGWKKTERSEAASGTGANATLLPPRMADVAPQSSDIRSAVTRLSTKIKSSACSHSGFEENLDMSHGHNSAITFSRTGPVADWWAIWLISVGYPVHRGVII